MVAVCSRFTRSFVLVLAAVSLAAAACQEAKPPPQVDAVRIDAFTATPSVVEAGKDVKLAWQTSGPVSEVRILRGQENLTTSASKADEFIVHPIPEGETVFTLFARGEAAGTEVSRDVKVRGVTSATIVSFSTDKSSVIAGSAAILSWETAAATKVIISAGGTELAQFADADALKGSLVVRPTAATEYTLTASDEINSVTQTLSISVISGPAITTATAEPARVKSGETTTLSWTTENTDKLTVKNAGRFLFEVTGDEAKSGSRTAELTADTTFDLIAEGSGGTATRQVSVSVIQAPRIISFQALPKDVVAGSQIILQWSTEGVDTCHLSADGVSIDPSETGVAVNDSVSLSPTQTTIYDLACAGEGGATSARLTVNVYGVPRIVAFGADKTTILRRRETATLSWQVNNASSVSIADSDGNALDLGPAMPDQGSVVVAPTATTKYILTATGEGGLISSDPLMIQVVDPEPSVALSLSVNPITPSHSSDLSWNVLDASVIRLTATGLDGVPQAVSLTGKGFNDLITVTPTETTVYTMEADGVGGHTEQSIQLTVIGNPHFESVTVDKTIVTRGKPFTVSWKAIDTVSVDLLSPAFAEGTSNPYVSIEGMPGTQALNPAIGDKSMSTLMFPAGFTFPFYGGTYAQAYVATDGYVCFDATQCSTTVSVDANQAMPSATQPNVLIAPFWDDLYTVANDSVQTGSIRSNFLWRIDGSAPNRALTIEWVRMELANSVWRPTIMNFKVVLYETGDYEIWNAPRIVPKTTALGYGYDYRYGTSATIGVEGPGGVEAWNAQSANDPSARALCRTFVPGNSTSTPKVEGQCDPYTLVRRKSFPAIGSQTLTADRGTAATMTVKLRATGLLGAADAVPLVVSLVDAPVATSLTAALTYVGAGEPVDLTWVAGPNKGALKSIAIADDHGNTVFTLNEAQINALSSLQGTVRVNPTQTSVYKLVVTNDANDTAVTTASIRVDKPTATFTVDKLTGPSGESHTFTWTTTAAQQLTVIGPDGVTPVSISGLTLPLTQPGDRTKIAGMTFPLTIATTGTYTLRATNGSGATEIPVTVTISPQLDVLSFASGQPAQTSGKVITLNWETVNTTDLKIEAVPVSNPTATPVTVVAPGTLTFAQRRLGNVSANVLTADTLFRLTATQDTTAPMVREVTVASVPYATATSFMASMSSVQWNTDPVTISWTTQGASTLRLYEMATLADGSPNGPEVAQARNQFNGSFTRTLLKATRYRLVMTNVFGDVTTVELASPILVQQTGVPTVTLSLADNVSAVPNGGYVDLSWTSSNVEKVYLWQRSPADASGITTGTVTGAGPDSVQVPFAYVPAGFVDISATGTPVTLRAGTSPTSAVNYDTGFAIMDLPGDFAPEFFGELEGRVLISADGVLQLAPPNTSDGSDRFFCSGSATGSCSTIPNYLSNLDQTTSTPLRALVAPFWGNLSAKRTCTGGTSDPSSCLTGRAPGQVFTQLVGQAPNRAFIVQWNNWDAATLAQAGSYTFQAKVYENGDIEYQYKSMQGTDPLFMKGGSTALSVGVERRFQSGTNYRNYYLQLPSLPSTAPTAANKTFINPGDGWKIFSGAQGLSGSLRSGVSFHMARTYGSTPPSAMFRATGSLSGTTPPLSSQAVNISSGVNQIVITEMMVDPVAGADDGQQWVEIRNLTGTAITLDGYVLQTSGVTYTFGSALGSDVLPASGYLLIGQENAMLPSGSATVAIRRLPNSATGLLLGQPGDAVILRYGQVLIDRVEYDLNAGWNAFTGKSIRLDGAITTTNTSWSFWNDDPAYWCSGRPALAWLGQTADPASSPGAVNPPCRYVDFIPYDATYSLAGDATAVVPMTTTSTDDRNSVDAIDIGFNFTYFGTTYTRINVNDNGFASFGTLPTSSTAFNAVLPSTFNGLDSICPFWDDLYRGLSGSSRSVIRARTKGTAPNRVFILMWDGYTYASGATAGEATFMAVLKETGEIEYHYATMNQNAATNSHKGGGATIGLEGMMEGYAITPILNSPVLPSPSQFALQFVKAP